MLKRLDTSYVISGILYLRLEREMDETGRGTRNVRWSEPDVSHYFEIYSVSS